MAKTDTSSTDNPAPSPLDRCRLVAIINGDVLQFCTIPRLQKLINAGDIASVIFSPNTVTKPLDENTFQSLIEPLVKVVQDENIAAIVADYSRVAGRVGADGLQVGQDLDVLREAIEKFTPAMMVGAANVKSRHNALIIGESQPDYVMFGKPGGDIKPQAHPKNIALGEWFASLVEIPSIVLGGNDPQSAIEVARSGVEFVALGAAIFMPNGLATDMAGAADRVQRINQLLDENAPRFQDPEN